MPAWSCMCFGKAESTGGREPVVGRAAAESELERVGCLRIDTGVTLAGRVAGMGADDAVSRDEDAAEPGLDAGFDGGATWWGGPVL